MALCKAEVPAETMRVERSGGEMSKMTDASDECLGGDREFDRATEDAMVLGVTAVTGR